MNKFNTYYYRVRDFTKIIYSILSVCFVIGVLFLTLYWLLSSDYYYHIRPFRDKEVVMTKEGAIFDTSLLIVGSGRMQYNQWIADETGKKVYTYKPFMMEASMMTSIKQTLNYLPPLPKGKYHIHAKLYYQVNPLKTSEIDIDLGGFEVK